ncbi:MAG: hypothetical protein WDO18_22520 [Acidobacteriota bacterium]
MRLLAALALLAFLCIANAQDYTAERTTDHGIPVIRLVDKAYHVEVAVAPTLGNLGYEMKVNGKNILYFPFEDLSAYQAKPVMSASRSSLRGESPGPACFLRQRQEVQLRHGTRQRRGTNSAAWIAVDLALLGSLHRDGRRPLRPLHRAPALLALSRTDGAVAVRP